MYIIVLGRTDFVHPFFSFISSQSGFIEMNLLQKMFLLVGARKNVIYSKLVNNPFNEKETGPIEMDHETKSFYNKIFLSSTVQELIQTNIS